MPGPATTGAGASWRQATPTQRGQLAGGRLAILVDEPRPQVDGGGTLPVLDPGAEPLSSSTGERILKRRFGQGDT